MLKKLFAKKEKKPQVGFYMVAQKDMTPYQAFIMSDKYFVSALAMTFCLGSMSDFVKDISDNGLQNWVRYAVVDEDKVYRFGSEELIFSEKFHRVARRDVLNGDLQK